MADINFVIPYNKSELLSDNEEQYYVRNVVSVKEIHVKLREAKQYFKDDGLEYIFETFSTYYSILHHSDNLEKDLILQAYEQLHKAAQALNNVIGFLLEDKESMNDEIKLKYANLIKMLLYIYTNIVIKIDLQCELKGSQITAKGRSRKKPSNDVDIIGVDKEGVLLVLNNIIQREIANFWDPPVVEETFTNMIAEVCYCFLEYPSIKARKELRVELFNILGNLIKSYNHGTRFTIRLGQLIKIKEHLVHCIPEGIAILVQDYNCKSLVRDFVREVTEWQTDENFQDAQGTRNCSNVLCELANLMPDLMIPEVMYLNRYLAHESYTLRNSVLQVITEVVLTVLTKSELNEEQKESRDELLSILEQHIDDVTAHVRAKVFQQWSRLQEENAIPLKIQMIILEKAILHLRDKAANVRKCAANCVTTFLSHNIYGAQLQLDKMVFEFEYKKKRFDKMKKIIEDDQVDTVKKLEEEWLTVESTMKNVIKENVNKENANEPTETQVAKNELTELVRTYIRQQKYLEAYEICYSAVEYYPEWQEVRGGIHEEQHAEIFLMLMHSIFIDVSSEKGKSENNNLTEEDLKDLETLEESVGYLSDAVDFLKLIDTAIKPMADLLESVSNGDMQEAVNFFISAYQFNINNALTGILELLKIMQRNEKERKDIIINAFKTIYLTTDASNMRAHTTTIIDRLIKLLQIIPFEQIEHLNDIVSEWVTNGTLDNSIIEVLWQYFTKKIDVSDDDSRAALDLLKMAAMGRRTIGSKNVKLTATIAFGDRGKNDPLLVISACRLLQVIGLEKHDVTNENPPFRVKLDDPMWTDLTGILIANFHTKNVHYNQMTSEIIGCIYKLCSRPEKLCESLLEQLVKSVNTKKDGQLLQSYVIAQCAHLLGEIALNQLRFLDESLYKELKRRNYIREENKNKTGKNKKDNRPSIRTPQNTSAIKKLNSASLNHSTVSEDSIVDENVMVGAQAEDTDAEFILNTLENHTISESSGLGKLAHLLVQICERPDIYDDLYVQSCAITALLRYMTVSAEFCQKNVQLVFTILQKTNRTEIKCNILIHCADLLERFPNIIEPWTFKMFDRLRDTCTEVRTVAFFMLAHLILRDMIRVQGHISEMACCVVDEQQQLREMSKNFFTKLSQRANNLYNVLPDIFTHLSSNSKLVEDDFKFIMKFLFGLIDKNKQMENLVDRFCPKFRLTDEDYKSRNIAYCLSLIQYNEKGLRRLQDNFPCYKNVLQNNDVYSIFKQILNTCNKSTKNEIKVIAAEIEEKINSVFDSEEGAEGCSNTNTCNPNTTKSQAAVSKSAFKKPRGRAPKRRMTKKSSNSDSDNSDEENQNDNTPAPRRTPRTKRTPRRNIFIDDSDSD